MNNNSLNSNAMRTKIKTIAFFLTATMLLFFSSCEDDDDVPEPIINNMEIGISNSHIAYIGSDLHLEGEIIAEGTIATITVELYRNADSNVTIDSTYVNYEGLKNTTFHRHIDIPDGTPAGTYQLRLTVYDQEGNQAVYEDEIEIEELTDQEAPEISISAAPESGKGYGNGETIAISGMVTDNISLAGMVVALVKESDQISDADVTGANTSVIIMLHTHAFDSEASHSFSASIAVGAANDNNMTPAPITGNNAWRSGNYYILVKCKDAKGNWAYSVHYPIVLNL